MKGHAMSSSYPPNPYEYQSAAPPPRQGMSTGVKVLLILGIILGVLVLLCCGGVMFLGVWGQRFAANSMSSDPAKIRALTDELLPLAVPAELAPEQMLDMPVPFTDQKMMRMAMYGHKPSGSSFAMMWFNTSMAPQNQGQMEQQMREQMRQQGANPDQQGNWQREASVRQITIRGQPVDFNFARLTDPETKKTRLELNGVVQGEGGPVMVFASVDESVVSEEKLLGAFEPVK
jgi:hypothetical protein